MKVFNWLCSNAFIAYIAYIISFAVPRQHTLKKYRNLLKTAYSIKRRLVISKGNPVNVLIAPIAVCNYRCLFCEIHKDNLLYPNRSKNLITLEDISNYESFLSSAFSLSFYGGSEEPLLNIHFGEIVSYLKSKYGLKMMVNTNASMLTEELSNTLVRHGFDSVLVSYHAGTEQGYQQLMTGDLRKVDKNIRYLISLKKSSRKNLPIVELNFALQKLNAPEATAIIDKAKEMGVDRVIVNHYYGGRNRLQDHMVSFDHDTEEGRMVLKKLYSYARQKSVNLHPTMPRYWQKDDKAVMYDSENYNRKAFCKEPWMNLHFKPVLDERNCHYVGVCNRIELFKLRYRLMKLDNQKRFEMLWNHQVLQYLRATVNSDDINPICKYCKNFDRERLRNVDADRYAEVRDKAISEFFECFREKYKANNVEGLEVLSENPHSDKKLKH